MNTDTDINIIDNISADTIEVGDQIIVEGDLVIVLAVKDTDDIDEVFIRVENLSDPTVTDFSLYADDYFDVWAV